MRTLRQFKQGNPLCDALGQCLGETRRDLRRVIAALENRIKQLGQQSSLESRFAELERHLDARQIARDEAKRGRDRGQKGDRERRAILELPPNDL